MFSLRYSLVLTMIAASIAACGGSDTEDGNGSNNGGDTGTQTDVGNSDDTGVTTPDVGMDCMSDCSTAGATRCDGNDLYECVSDGNGCFVWSQLQTCGGGLFCSGGQCVSQCQDACSTVGARQCEAGGAGRVTECAQDANGCLVWEPVQTCTGLETCSAGACSTQCTDECTTVNERQCEGDGYKVCGNFDADPCLDWGDPVPCVGQADCSAGYCSVQCTDECQTAGVDECVAGVAAKRTCGDFDADPCLEWGTTINCAADEVCQNAACVYNDPCAGVSCNTPPADSCVNANTARNYGAGVCDGAGGCDYGYVDTDCPSGCQNGACVAPTCGNTVCNAPPANTCASASELTRYYAVGACNAGNTCAYQSSRIRCSEGCFQGACIAGSWETEIPSLPAVSNTAVDVTFDATGNPRIAYCNIYTGTVFYRWRDAGGWHEETVDPALGAGCELALALDAQGRPMIAYYDPTNDDLRFGRKEAGTWNLSLISTAGDVGSSPSVSLTPTGQPIVAFRDITNGQLKTATLNGATWQTDTIGPWSGSGNPITTMRWGRSGDLYVLAGASRSVANAANTYNQPPVYLHTRRAGVWSTLTLHEDGFTSRDGLAIAPNGEVLVQVGEVLQVGSNDSMVVIRTDGTQVLSESTVREYGNLLYLKPVGLFNTDTMLESVMDDPFLYRLDDHGYWVERTGKPWNALGNIQRVLWRLGADTVRFFHSDWSITTPAACTPQCNGISCGSDGCGGVCGQCPGGESCNPLGQCSLWNYETPDAAIDKPMVATGMDEVHTFAYSSTQGLQYSTNTSGAWTTTATGVDDTTTANTYDMNAVAVDSMGYIHIATTQARPTFYNAWDKIEVFSQGPMGWTSTIAGQFFSAGQALSFVIDDNDAWHFAFAGRSYPNYAGSVLTYLNYENGMGTPEVVATPVDLYNRGYGYVYQPNLQVDSQGHAFIFWIQTLTYTNQTSLRFSTNASGTWVDTAIVDPYSSGSTGIWMGKDATDKLHAVYTLSGNTPLKYGTYDATAGMWTWENGPSAVYSAQFGLDPSGVPFFTDGDTNSINIYRRVSAGNWPKESIPVRNFGSPIRVMFDDAANMHLIYRAGGGTAQYQTRHVWK